jgi:hypothetical protein
MSRVSVAELCPRTAWTVLTDCPFWTSADAVKCRRSWKRIVAGRAASRSIRCHTESRKVPRKVGVPEVVEGALEVELLGGAGSIRRARSRSSTSAACGVRHWGVLHDPADSDRRRRVVPAADSSIHSEQAYRGLNRPCPLRARSTGTQRQLAVATGLSDTAVELRKRLIGVGWRSPCTGLENRYGVSPIVGSNPTPSASTRLARHAGVAVRTE